MLRRILMGHPETFARLAGWLFVVSICGGILCVRYHVPGILTVMQIAALAISSAMHTDFRRERGLWLQSGLYLLLYTFVYGVGLLGEAQDVLRGVAAPFIVGIDATIATVVLSIHLKLLWNVSRANFRFFRGLTMDENSDDL